MSGNSKIEWTEKTWNPVTGCTKVSQGCKHCYAEGVAERFFAKQYPPNPDGSPRRFTDVRCHEDRLDAPLHWRKPSRIFVNSMSDLFHPDVPFEFIDKVFAAMAVCAEHTFQILTKRPERMRQYLTEIQDDEKDMHRWEDAACELSGSPCSAGVIADAEWPLCNVWLGVSIEDQKTADERIPLLLQTPAAVRWISYEPALGPVDLTAVRIGNRYPAGEREDWRESALAPHCFMVDEGQWDLPGLNWVVCGGESGPQARPMHPDWARSMRDQCQAAGVRFFFKQWGEWHAGALVGSQALVCECGASWKDGNHPEPYCGGGKPCVAMHRIGKHAAGRLLNGVEWNEYPERAA